MEEVKNEGPKEMTLDEWKAMQDKERTKVEFNIRKPNEGTDSQWKKGYVLHKSKSEDVSLVTPFDSSGVGMGRICKAAMRCFKVALSCFLEPYKLGLRDGDYVDGRFILLPVFTFFSHPTSCCSAPSGCALWCKFLILTTKTPSNV